MHYVIIVVFLVGVIMLAGSAVANSVSIDLSAGPVAEGRSEVLQAEAEGIAIQNAADAAASAQDLQDQQQVDDATLQTRVTTLKIVYWVLGIVGGLALTVGLIMAAVNIAAAMSITNMRFVTRAVVQRSGGQAAWTFPLIPGVAFLTNDDSPQVIAMLTANTVGVFEPRDPVGLALAGVLRQRAFADTSNEQTERTVRLMGSLAGLLSGVPRACLTANAGDEKSRRK